MVFSLVLRGTTTIDSVLKRVAESFDLIHSQTQGYKTQILIETTAGQGTNLGYRFEHLAKILDMVQEPERLGVCFDTCHAFAAGYELRTEEGYQATFEAFDKILGLEKLKVIHLNDSLKGLGSRRDRHQGIGKGEIGLDGFRLLMNDSRFGLTASVWTTDQERAEWFAGRLKVGTVYQNRCDYLDPGLPWTGVGDSGMGSSLSKYGFYHLTRRKSIHFRTRTQGE